MPERAKVCAQVRLRDWVGGQLGVLLDGRLHDIRLVQRDCRLLRLYPELRATDQLQLCHDQQLERQHNCSLGNHISVATY